MARWIRLGLWSATVFLMYLCWGTSMGIGQQVTQQPTTVSFRYKEEQFTTAQVVAIRKLEEKRTDGAPVLITAWYQNGTAKLSSGNGKGTTAQYIWVNGSSKRLFAGELMSGQWLDGEDSGGCLISSDTAYELYGSTLVDGLELEIDDKTYQIMGVLRGAKGAVILNDTENKDKKNNTEEKVFLNLTLEITDGKNPAIAAQEFSSRHSITPPPITVSSTFHVGTAGILAALGGAVLAITMIFKLVQNLWSVRMNNRELLIWSIIFVAVVWVLVWSVGNRFSFPESMIPSKWSDFEFWNKTFKNLFTEISQFMRMEKYKPDEYIWNLLSQQVLLTGALAVTMGLSIWTAAKMHDTNLFIQELLCILLAFAVVALSISAGTPLETDRGYWLLFPLTVVIVRDFT